MAWQAMDLFYMMSQRSTILRPIFANSLIVVNDHGYTSNIKMKHPLYTYKTLVTLTTPYATRMNRLSNQIFGEVVRPTSKKSMRVVKMYSELPRYKDPNYIDYYPRHVETGWLMYKLREYGLFRDEHLDFKEEMRRLRALRGKTWVKGEKKAKASTFL